jgi:hypothetical protein
MTPTYEQVKLWFTPERAAKFWSLVNILHPRGCWIWTGALTDTGHGQTWMQGGTVRVHRLTWILARQADIPDWMVIRHFMCNQRTCCNPAHLVGGTQGENVQDIWYVHKAYDLAQEMEARSEYRQHPYVGYFSDLPAAGEFVQCENS